MQLPGMWAILECSEPFNNCVQMYFQNSVLFIKIGKPSVTLFLPNLSNSIISLLIISAVLETFFEEFNSKEFKRRSFKSSYLQSHVIYFLILTISVVLTYARNKLVRNAREIHKRSLLNNCKGLLPNNNTNHSCRNIFRIIKATYFESFAHKLTIFK